MKNIKHIYSFSFRGIPKNNVYIHLIHGFQERIDEANLLCNTDTSNMKHQQNKYKSSCAQCSSITTKNDTFSRSVVLRNNIKS